MSIEIRPDVLDPFEIEVIHHGRWIRERQFLPVTIEPLGTLNFLAPFGNFERFHEGRLEVLTGLEIRYRGQSLDLHRASLVPREFDGQPGMVLMDSRNRPMLHLTHFHVLAVPEENRLEIKNADIYPTAEFARALGFPDHSAVVLGMAVMDLDLSVPPGADASQISGECTTPVFPQEGLPADVALINIASVQQMGSSVLGEIKVTPSATLKNVGQADVPWVPKFNINGLYPYEPRDQHPYLLWSMYRIHDGRIEMLANSGAKHAWFTVNTNCPCFGGNILWPQCEDVYGNSINDNGNDLGPREDIVSHLGLFESCNSFFDPGCQGTQTESSGSGFENRMVVNTAELQSSGASYFFDSWYVVQYDVDIWNTMGYRSISPSPVSAASWGFSPLGVFTAGSVLNEWIAEGTADPMEGHQIVVVDGPTPEAAYPGNMPSGHLRVLGKAAELGGADYRYNYAVMNFDFDNGISEFFVPLPSGAQVSETLMSGPADVLSTAWTASVEPRGVRFSAAPGDKLPWFTLYNFEIVVDQAPVIGGFVTLGPSASDPDAGHLPAEIVVDMVAPSSVRIFADRFEAP